jgi:hypothetical protein
MPPAQLGFPCAAINSLRCFFPWGRRESPELHLGPWQGDILTAGIIGGGEYYSVEG